MDNVAREFRLSPVEKDEADLQLVLEEPRNPSCHLGERIAVCGMLLSRKAVDAHFAESIKLSIEEIQNGGQTPCEIVSPRQHTGRAFFESFTTESIRRRLFPHAFRLCGILNLSALVPEEGRSRFQLRLRSGQDLLSNPVEVMLVPRVEWNQAYGGFLFPVLGTYGAEFLVVRGWALKRGDRLSSIEIFLNGKSVGKARTGLSHPEILLVAEGNNDGYSSMFELSLAREEVRGFIGRLGSCLLTAKCVFASGDVLSLQSPNFVWRLPTSGGEICGVIVHKNRFEASASRIASWLGILPVRQRSLKHIAASSTKSDRPVLFATHNLSPYEGAPRVLAHVACAFANTKRRNRKCVVVSPRDGELRQVFTEQGIEVFIIPELDIVGQTFERYFRGVSLLEEHFPSAALCAVVSNVIDVFWGEDFARLAGIPSLWMIHESISPQNAFSTLDPRLKMRFLHRLAKAQEVVFVSEQTRKLYLPHLTGKSLVIPNGVNLEECDAFRKVKSKNDIRAKLKIREDETVMSIIGTTTHRKGQDVFLREMAVLLQTCPERKFRFFIVGAREIPYLDTLYQLSETGELKGKVEFVFETEDVADYYVASDVVVIASREESAPLVSLEAFAYGVPLVSTNVFGLSEQVMDGENALVFDLEKHGDLAEKVAAVLSSAELRERLIGRARADVEQRFSLNKSVEAHLKAIESL